MLGSQWSLNMCRKRRCDEQTHWYTLILAVCFVPVIQTTTFQEKPVDTLAIVSNNTQFNCSFTDVDVLFEAGWYKGGTLIAIDRNVLPTYTRYEIIGAGDEYHLRIYDVDISDEDTFTCQDRINIDITASADLFLIDSRPNCDINPDETVIDGDDFILTCIMDLDDSAPGDLVWYQNGVEVMRNTGMNNTWTTSLNKDNDGDVFDCQLEHYTLPRPKWSHVSCEEKIVMNVQYDPVVNISTNISDCVVEWRDYYMECHADGNPEPTVIWVTPDGTTTDESLLKLNNIQTDDSGEYVCNATNVFWDGTSGEDSSRVVVPEIEALPDVFLKGSSESSDHVNEGDTVVFECRATGETNDTFHLQIQHTDMEGNEEPTAEAYNVTMLTYTISSFNESYVGSYICIATTLVCDGTYAPRESNRVNLTPISGSTDDDSSSIWIIIIIIIAVVGITVAIILAIVWYKKKKQPMSVVGSPSTNGRGAPDGFDLGNAENPRGNEYELSPYGVSASVINPVVNTPKDVQPSTSVSDPNIDQMYAQPHKKRAPAKKDVQPSTSMNDPNIDQMYAQPHKKRASAKKAPDYNPENLVYAELSHATGKLVLPRARLDHGLASPTDYATVDMSKLK